MMEVGSWIIFLMITLTSAASVVEGRKIDDDLIYQQGDAVRRRLSEVRQFLLPMPEHQWDQLLHHFAALLAPVNAVSETCRNHSQHLKNSFLNQDIWALRMIDAGSKFQSGILDGYLHNLGNYAQCISVEEPNQMFRGQHCVIETTGVLPPDISAIVTKEGWPYIGQGGMFSLCVPSSCSDLDVITHVDASLATIGAKSKFYLEELSLSTDIKKISCTTAEGLPFRTKDYVAMFVFASLTLVVLLATLIRAQSGWLSYFSLSKNFQELMDTSTSPSDITCLRGLKVLLCLQIIHVHRLFTILFLPHIRLWTVLKIFGEFAMDTIELTYPKAVDLFFLLGGLTLSYSFLMKIRRREDFNYSSHIFKRYFRVTPTFAAVALFDATLLVHSSHGPVWIRNVADFEDRCHVNWWSSLLHVSNILNPEYSCVLESWSVACDFQLQCIAPFILLLFLQRPRLGLTIAFMGFLLSTAALTAAAYYLELSYGYWVAAAFWDRLTDLHIAILYKSPIIRLHPFLMGLVLGYLMHYCRQIKGYANLSKRTAWLGWTATVAAMAGLWLVNKEVVSPDHEFTPVLDPLYVGLSRQIFCACTSWLIFACHFGCGGNVNSFLSWPGFRPLSKLVFSACLVHINLQLIQLATMQAPINFKHMDQIFLYFGDVTLSFLVAVVMYTTIELPFYKLSIRFIKDFETSSKNTKKQ